MNRHQLTYIDLHPAPVKPARSWVWAALTLAVFACWGVMLAWRG